MPLLFVLFGLLPFTPASQSVLFTDQSNSIYEYNPMNCQVRMLFKPDLPEKFRDLTFDAAGNLYLLTLEGKLFSIDQQTRSVKLIYSFLNLQTFTSVCCSKSNIVYVTGSEGFVYSYDLFRQTEYYLGDLGYTPSGGMVFLQERLFISALNKQIIEIDPVDFKFNQVHKLNINQEIQTLFNAPAAPGNCQKSIGYAVTQDGNVLALDVDRNSTKVVCKPAFLAGGSASSYDFISDLSPMIRTYETESSACDQPTGTITIHATRGAGNIRYSADGVHFQEDSLLTRLSPGKYSVFIQDQNNCPDSVLVEVMQKEGPSIRDIQIEPAGCQGGGKISIMASSVYGPLRYAVDDGLFQEARDFEEVKAGKHITTVRDNHGCSDTVEINVPLKESVIIDEVASQPSTCNLKNGRIQIVVLSNQTIRYALDGQSAQNHGEFARLDQGLHLLTIKSENGCSLDTSIVVETAPCPVFIPNVFTPNQDSKNEIFQIFSAEGQDILVKRYTIIGRWGQIIYQAENFPIHSTGFWWDGTQGNLNLEAGVFMYEIVLEFPDKSIQTYRGTVALIK